MSDSDAQNEELLNELAKPKSVSVDGQSIQRRDLREVMEVQDRIAADQAVRSRRGGLRITKLRPPGSI